MSENIEITKENCNQAEAILKELGRGRLSGHTSVLISQSGPLGTVLLVKSGRKKYLVTAAHVVEGVGTEHKAIGLVIKADDVMRHVPLHSSDLFHFKRWDPSFRSRDLLQEPLGGKDLAAMEVPVFLESGIDATKEYINLDESVPMDLDFSAAYVGFGVMRVEGEISMTSLGVVLGQKLEREGRDYYIAKAMKDTLAAEFLKKPTITDFRGYSGGGLFLYDGKNIRLVGIAYYQNGEALSQENGYVEIYFYGPQSIRRFFADTFSEAAH